MLNHDVNRRPLTTSARLAAVGGLLAVTLPIAGLVAQVFGSVTGTVTDPFGGLIPNVTLTLSHAGSTARHEVRSDQTGAFQFVGLRPGDYRLEARVPGFADLTRELTLTAGQTLPLPLTLQIGSVQETITVRGGPNDAERPSRQAVSRRSAQGEPCSPSPVGGRIVPPRKIVDVRPQYPASLRGATTESRVALEARIGTDGSVTDLRTVSAPDVDVESAASTAVSQWLFTPTLLNCVPVDVKMTVTVSFKPQ
jgi:TonB family protein